jgi:wobble nucleotide-excising tRNase
MSCYCQIPASRCRHRHDRSSENPRAGQQRRRSLERSLGRGMLKKLINIKNVGRYRKSAAQANPQLERFTLVFAPNGFGKTTLCAILRSLASGEAAHIEGRKTLGSSENPEVELLLASGAVKYKNGAWNQTLPDLAIFDNTFISENVHSGDTVELENKRNLYRVIIGQEGVALAEQDTALAAESRAKATEITTAAKALLLHAPKGTKVEDFLKLPADATIDQKIADQEKEVDAAKQSTQIKAKAGFREYLHPTLPAGLASTLSKTLAGVSADAEQLIADHLKAHAMEQDGEQWLSEGLPQIASDKCPFCAQSVKGSPLVDAYKAVFSEAYQNLKDEVAALREVVQSEFGDAAIGQLELADEQNATAFEYWQQFCDLDESDLSLPEGTSDKLRALRSTMLALLGEKARAPLEPIDAARLSQAQDEIDAIEKSISTPNKSLRAAQALVDARKVMAGTANLAVAESELEKLRCTKKRHESGVAQACKDYQSLEKDKEAIDLKKTAVRTKLDTHTLKVVKPYERRINELLDAFNAGFSITETKHAFPGGTASSSYQLVINSTAIDLGDSKTPSAQASFKNTLSAGDRTTLALAFFIANLEQDPDMAEKVVVFDDPFSSQDAYRRRQTVHEIRRVGAQCAQVVVLSHDPAFLKQVWEKAPHDQRAAVQIFDARAQGSQITRCDIDEACKGRVASEIDDLQAFVVTGAGKSRDIIKKMRVVLESYCRTTFGGSFLPTDNLGGMVGKIRGGGATHPAAALHDELDQINDYTQGHHHGDDPTDGTADIIDDQELKGFARRTLRVVNAVS